MIDFKTTYELLGHGDQAFLSPQFRGRQDINGFAIARGEAELPEDVTFAGRKAGFRGDIIATGFASLYLISSRLAEGLKVEGMSGWRSAPVRFEGGSPVDGAFHTLSVVGRCGPIRHELSEVSEHRDGRNVRRYWRGAYFDPETWDGSDMFTPIDRGTLFVVSKVREFLRRHDLHGIRLVPLDSVEEFIFPRLVRDSY